MKLPTERKHAKKKKKKTRNTNEMHYKQEILPTKTDELSTPHANFDLYMGTFSYVHQPGLYM